MFPLLGPVIARELRRQYTALEHICARAASSPVQPAMPPGRR